MARLVQPLDIVRQKQDGFTRRTRRQKGERRQTDQE